MSQKAILMILDGWGKSPDPSVSAVDQAKTPFIDGLYTNYSHNCLRTDGLHVGLPEGQMGNSEVGHINLGAGRIVYQDLAKINLAVENDTLKDEVVLKEAKEQNKEVRDHMAHIFIHGVLHLLGYDHHQEAQAEIMENLERRILSKIGVADPY